MEKISKSIIFGVSVLGVVYVLFRIGSYLIIPLFVAELTPSAYTDMEYTKIKLGTIEMFFNYGFNLCTGIFLSIQTVKHKENGIKYPLFWLFLGGVFGLSSIILFYIYMIYLKMSQDEKKSSSISTESSK